MSIVSTVISYTFSNVDIRNFEQMKAFLAIIVPRGKKYHSATYDSANQILTVNTKETAYSTDTFNVLNGIIRTEYPDPPAETQSEVIPTDSSGNVLFSASVYGYFSTSTAVDGDVVISKNTSLTRNMYYNNLTVNANCTLRANGWRIVVTNTLTLYGTISNDGSDASGVIAGTGSAPIYTTYLGAGSQGGAGLSASGSGNGGVSASYQCSGGEGGNGGSATGTYAGGLAGVLLPISAVDGGINTLGTMPTAFLGRLISSNFYVMGGTGGGGGGCSKGNATTVRSGAGGGAGGLMIVAAKNIIGSGSFSAKGGNGSSGTWTGTGTQISGGIGGGGGGGGGCIIIISQGILPSTISFNTSGGTGGTGISPGKAGVSGDNGVVFFVDI